MTIDQKALREMVKGAMKLQRKLENDASKDPKDGYAKNQFGSFDRVVYTNAVLGAFQELNAAAPEEDYFSFLFAGALARATRFDEAARIYESVASGKSGYVEPATLMLASVLLQMSKTDEATAALGRYNSMVEARGAPMLRKSRSDIEIGGSA